MATRRAVTTLAVGAAAGALGCALLTTDVVGTGTRLVGGLLGGVAAPAAAAGLPRFDDCEQLRRWYVDAALPHVGPWGFGPPVSVDSELTEAGELPALGGPATGVASSGTGTNVQEPGVDESDVAKTDGNLVVRVVGRRLVVTDVTTPRPREVSRTVIPGPALIRPELLLRDGRALVVGDETPPQLWPGAVGDSRILPVPRGGDTRAHLVSFDLRDPDAPRVTDDRTVDGGALSTREYGDGTVRVVVTTGFPPLDFVRPTRDRSPREAIRANRDLVRSTPIEAWLPAVRSSGGDREPLLDCSRVRHPGRPSGFGTISVLTFPIDRPDRVAATAVTAAGDLVYSSSHRLYVATSTGAVDAVPLAGPAEDAAAPRPPTTQVHAFALDGDRTSYVASGAFRGTVRDRWSLSEYDGHLRVAAALGPVPGQVGPGDRPDRGSSHNGVLVFAERNGRLVRIGAVDGIGRGEDIESVRWFGDLAVVVTFRRTDPVYTLDLSNPTRPRVVGALEVPGFSSYLHPVGGDVLVGIGHDVSPQTGADRGAQAATFDLRDLRRPRRVDTVRLGPEAEVDVAMDPRAFTYLPNARVLVTPVQDWALGRARFVALRVSTDGSLTAAGSWTARSEAGEDVRALPLEDGRLALVADAVRVVDVR